MTSDELENWIEDHYDELWTVAYRQTYGCDVEDVLHNALKLATTPLDLVWTWATSCTRSAASHMQRSAQRQGRVCFEADNLTRTQKVIAGGTGGGTQTQAAPTD